MKFTTKLIFFAVLIGSLVLGKFALFDYPISTGKRAGNLTKLILKGKIIKTWEGTIDEGSGDQLTSQFSVRDSALAQELYEYEGRQVVLYYEQYYWGWPRDTNYNIVSWKPMHELVKEDRSMEDVSDKPSASQLNSLNLSEQILSKTLFCSFLGALINNKDLYLQVKEHIKENNLYLYKQYDQCNH